MRTLSQNNTREAHGPKLYSFFGMCDDLLKGLLQMEEQQSQMKEPEVMTTAIHFL